jgi:hypothetical protein
MLNLLLELELGLEVEKPFRVAAEFGFVPTGRVTETDEDEYGVDVNVDDVAFRAAVKNEAVPQCRNVLLMTRLNLRAIDISDALLLNPESLTGDLSRLKSLDSRAREPLPRTGKMTRWLQARSLTLKPKSIRAALLRIRKNVIKILLWYVYL